MAEPQTKASDSKRLERPNKEEHETEVKVLDDQIKAQKEIVDSVKAKLDKLKEDKDKRIADAAAAAGEKKGNPEQDKLLELRNVTKSISAERKASLEQLKKLTGLRDTARSQLDDMRKRLKELNCNSTEDVDKKISNLEYYLATNPLTLKEEKVVIADIKVLTASKKIFAEHDVLKANKDKLEAQVKELTTKLDEGKIALDKARAEEETQYKHIGSLREKRENTKSDVPALIESKNKAREEMNRLYTELKAKRDTFYKLDREFQKLTYERRKEQMAKRKEEEEKYREETRLRRLQEEEEKLDGLHANDLATVDQLTSYLKKFLDEKVEEEEKAVVEIKAPEGVTRIGKTARDFDDDFLGTKKGKKESKGPKKPKAKRKLVHDLKCIQEFEGLKINAPLSTEDIPATLEALTAKKAEFLKSKEEKKAQRLAEIAQLTAEVAKKQEQRAKDAEAKAEEKATEEAAPAAEPAEPAATAEVEATA